MFSPTKGSRLLAAALLCAALLAPTSSATTHYNNSDAPPPEVALPFAAGEELVYQADFSRLLLRGIEIAEMRFSFVRVVPDARAAAADGQTTPAAAALVYTGDVNAKGWFRKLFGIDFHYRHESYVDPASLRILRTTKLDEQGKRVRLSESVFDRATNLQTWTERNPNDAQAQPRVVRNVLDGAAHDFISAIYFLRTQQLKPGQTLELVVGDSGETFRVPVRVWERKTLKTVVGKVPALRVEVGLFGAGRLVNDRTGEMSAPAAKKTEGKD
ncbi:MAG: DUF3108 domain-containing protein [Acidobacteria bacterium]|nr:DUF3108 domain-containing protein [Acidobacteriota bacterium]